jgi:hypothetical protein
MTMASVVIIHAPDDAMPARALADKVRRAGVSVVLEQPSGQPVRDAVSTAAAVIALWSPRSAANDEIVNDVLFARDACAVLHATMQNAAAPDLFGGEPAVNLTGWRGEDDFAAWRELGSWVTQAAGAPPLPTPQHRQAPGFFQPGRPEAPNTGADAPKVRRERATPLAIDANGPPRLEEERRPPPLDRPPLEPETGNRSIMTIAIAAIAVAALGGGGIWYITQSGAASSAASWEQVDHDNADALRAFLAGRPGSWRDEAEDALAGLEERHYREARNADTIEAYQTFLQEFPDSNRFGLSARGRIAELRSAPTATGEDETTGLLPPAEGLPLDPDLVPPNAVPEPSPGDGPVALNPAAPEPAPTPSSDDGPVDLGAPPTN